MRILWLITRYWPAVGGAETHSRQIIQHLALRGHEITVVTHWDENRTDWLRGTTVFAPGTVRHYEDKRAAHVVRLGYGASRRASTVLPAASFYLRQAGATRTLARMLEADILRECGANWDVIHGVRVGREPLYVAGHSLAQTLGVPFVFTPLHHPRWIGRHYHTYLGLYAQADAVIALTEYERALYASLGVDPQHITVSGIGPVLPPRADGARFRATHNIRGPLVLFLGQKYPYKGYENLLAAARTVWQRHPDAVFAFLGPRTDTSRRVFSHVDDTRVLELDAVDLQTKGDALAACDVFCLPSAQESFGGVYTEAWHYAKPVIGCNIPAVREVIADGVSGLLARPHDVEDLAAQIERLLADTDLRLRLGACGRETVERRYTWERIASHIEDAYIQARAQLAVLPVGARGKLER